MNSYTSHRLGSLLSKCLSHSFWNLTGYSGIASSVSSIDAVLLHGSLHYPLWTIFSEPFLQRKKKKKKLCRDLEEIRYKISVCRGADNMGWIIRTWPLLEGDTKANPEPGPPRELTGAQAARAVSYRRFISVKSQGREGEHLDPWRLYWLEAKGHGYQRGQIKRAQIGIHQEIWLQGPGISSTFCVILAKLPHIPHPWFHP